MKPLYDFLMDDRLRNTTAFIVMFVVIAFMFIFAHFDDRKDKEVDEQLKKIENE